MSKSRAYIYSRAGQPIYFDDSDTDTPVDSSAVALEDICWSLSGVIRYGGHADTSRLFECPVGAEEYYSVAHHLVLCDKLFDSVFAQPGSVSPNPNDAMTLVRVAANMEGETLDHRLARALNLGRRVTLFHDLAESCIHDITSPMKRQPWMMDYRYVEYYADNHFAERFGLTEKERLSVHDLSKRIDGLAYEIESSYMFPDSEYIEKPQWFTDGHAQPRDAYWKALRDTVRFVGGEKRQAVATRLFECLDKYRVTP